jgi:hypothetical protein
MHIVKKTVTLEELRELYPRLDHEIDDDGSHRPDCHQCHLDLVESVERDKWKPKT